MPRKKRKAIKKEKEISYIKKGAIAGGIFGIILVILLNLLYSSGKTFPILNIFTFIPSFIAMILFTIQHFIFQGKLFGNPRSSILYFISFVIIIFYVLIGTTIAYLIKKYFNK